MPRYQKAFVLFAVAALALVLFAGLANLLGAPWIVAVAPILYLVAGAVFLRRR